MAEDEKPHQRGNTPPSYESLLNSARAFHEFVFKVIGSSAVVSLLQTAAFRAKSAVLLFLLVLAYAALVVFVICFSRFVLFASFEQKAVPGDGRAALLWIAAGIIMGLAVALPSVFSRVVAVLLKQGLFL